MGPWAAKARGEQLQAHGAEAVLALGLTTQVPMKSIFYTSGPSRKIQVGQQEVLLKHANSRLLVLGNGPVGMAFTALWYMGKQQVTPETLRRIRGKLTSSEFAELRNSTQLPPWLSEAFQKFDKGEALAFEAVIERLELLEALVNHIPTKFGP